MGPVLRPALRNLCTRATGALGGCALGGALGGSAGAWLGTLAGLLIADISLLHEQSRFIDRAARDHREDDHQHDHHRGQT
jgi:hypothetical protein